MSNLVGNGADGAGATGADLTGILTVTAIIVLAGLLGGWAAFLTLDRRRDSAVDESAQAPLIRYLVLGVVASAAIPLFLSIVQSDLIRNIFDVGARPPFTQYLVLVGFCLIAAFSARAFLDSVSRRVLRDLETVQEQQQELRQQVRENTELIDEQEAQELADGNAVLAAAAEAPAHLTSVPAAVSGDDRRVLQAMMALTFRTATGVASDLGIDRRRAAAMLQDLASRGLVERTVSPKTNGPRWRITTAGIAALGS